MEGRKEKQVICAVMKKAGADRHYALEQPLGEQAGN
jgi:hypothetical protein